MTHYVLLKFKKGYFNPQILKRTKDVYQRIRQEVKGVIHTEVHQNCFVQENNFDLMMKIVVDNEQSLKDYIQSDIHQEYIRLTNDYVVGRAAIDCESIQA